ncbi:SDR family NAD(P)-dependent oxidoreductase [Arenibaculum sp.]|jgi:NAD(P)-dependent dehydrogenase (short-subunit alcohol dehydrogenase family)|uniref:SDR family NAD(P)-dependent oxidoreductase n=1 Tax=Arenibaculum sp. TaxID=2865862 RepID=UPI002E1020BB|nr:SDR family NAD(P)-dependent oxidoreductase [Arenibaculum sp.]
MARLKDGTCIVTGGAGSLGRAAARRFAEEGAKVVLVDLDRDALEEVGKDLPADRVAVVAADVSKAEDARRYVAAAVERFGPVDVLFSNAGNFGVVRPVQDFPEDVFDAVLAVHVRGAFLAAKYAVPHMRDGGSIVITSSVAGLRGDAGVHAYIAAKHAQVGLMRCLAKELAPRRIRVNTVHPGPIGNHFQRAVEDGLSLALGVDGTAFFDAMIPLARHGTPEEVAEAVLFLASDRSSFTTGTMLMVDGGMSV